MDTIIINNRSITDSIAEKYAGCDRKNAKFLKELFVSPSVSNFYTAEDKTEHVNVFLKPKLSESCMSVKLISTLNQD